MFKRSMHVAYQDSNPYCAEEVALTKRKIHEASEMEPKTPESASCAVNGMLCNILAGELLYAQRVGGQQLVVQIQWPAKGLQKMIAQV